MLKNTGLPAETLHDQLQMACQAMVRYACANGMKVPPDLVEKLDSVVSASDAGSPTAGAESGGVDAAEAPRRDGAAESRRLTQVHNRLAEIVAPATPQTILLMMREAEKKGIWAVLGAVPLVRRLMAVSVISMVAFVLVSLSPEVNGTGFDLLNSHGWDLLLNELFLLAAASIGASFANLFQAQGFIKKGTFDPKYESSYWVRYVLGMMAGTILALLIPIEQIAPDAPSNPDFMGDNIIEQLAKPTLALLGGFASSAVYRILSWIVSALERVVKSDARDAVEAQEQLGHARSAQRDLENRARLAAKLDSLEQELLKGGGDSEPLRQELAKLRQNLVLGEDA